MAERIATEPAGPARPRGLVLAVLALAACLEGKNAASASAGPTRAGSAVDQLRALRDKARPIVVVSDTPDDSRVAAQMSALHAVKAGFAERDVSVLREARIGGALRRALGIADHGFAVVLVGKDGTVKEVWHAPVDPRRVFALIDAMPMRRREMGR